VSPESKLTGAGTIARREGRPIGGRRQYELNVMSGERDRHRVIEGRIGWLTAAEPTTLVGTTDLVLTLEDGRSLPFVFTSEHGDIKATGRLSAPQREDE
jgi:hypothetical protein